MDFWELPFPVMSQDGMALAIWAEAYAVQPPVLLPNPSGNTGLNPCKPGGFTIKNTDATYEDIAIPLRPEGLELPCDETVNFF